MAAALAGVAGYFISPNWIFYLVAALGLASLIWTARVREIDIDHRLARGSIANDQAENPYRCPFFLQTDV